MSVMDSTTPSSSPTPSPTPTPTGTPTPSPTSPSPTPSPTSPSTGTPTPSPTSSSPTPSPTSPSTGTPTPSPTSSSPTPTSSPPTPDPTSSPTSPSPTPTQTPDASPTPSAPAYPAAPPSPTSPGLERPGTPNIDVHGSTFTKAAGGFIAEHDELAKDIRRILDAIAALGDFAGTDETANTFKQGYSTALKKSETYINALRDSYPAVAERLAAIKTGFDVANWASIESLPKVSDPPKYSESDGKLIP